jgi:hypothetical protein
MSAETKLNRGLRVFFSEFVRVSLRRPSQAAFFARTVVWQAQAARCRARAARQDGTMFRPSSSSLSRIAVTCDRQVDIDPSPSSRHPGLTR